MSWPARTSARTGIPALRTDCSTRPGGSRPWRPTPPPSARTGHFEKKGAGRPDGCATFFRKEVFALRGTQRLDYHDRGEGREDSGHVALLLALEHGGRLLGVANTHVRWDRPRTPPAEQVGLRQILELLEACQRFIPPCAGWLVCGDFNRPSAMRRCSPHPTSPRTTCPCWRRWTGREGGFRRRCRTSNPHRRGDR